MPRNQIVAVPFGGGALGQAIAEHCRNPNAASRDQVGYLERYCEGLNAKTLVIEAHYICRHFVDEYAYFYSRNLRLPHRNSVARIHVFDAIFSSEDVDNALAEAVRGGAKNGAAALQHHYLGFVSVRPLPEAPVGRTVLIPYSDGPDGPRSIPALATYAVHLASVKLTVKGLAFQQQDAAAGACATAALWTAVSRVARIEHIRAPTPADVSTAATGQGPSNGPAVSAGDGLTMEQLARGVRALGFADEACRADQKPELFFAWLHTYLLSGMPVVLALWNPDDTADAGHAVAAAGFQLGARPNPSLQGPDAFRSARITKLYLHDDRVGPFARAIPVLKPLTSKHVEDGREPTGSPEDDEAVFLVMEHAAKQEVWFVSTGLVPVYAKLRLRVSHLIDLADTNAELVEHAVGATLSGSLEVEFQYQRAGDYLEGLTSQAPVTDVSAFLQAVALPRWCGIVRWYLDEDPLVEFVYDTTDIVRGAQSHRDLLRAVVTRNPAYRSDLSPIGAAMNVPFL